MDRIKKFNELFDDENLKSLHEIDYLSGKFNKFKIDVDFKDEDMSNFIAKLATIHYPMFIAFDDANRQENGFLDVGKARLFCTYDEISETWFLVAGNKTHTVVFGIKINSVNNYDLLLSFDSEKTERGNSTESEQESNTEFEYYGISYNRVIELIESVYIPFLKKAGFTELLNYESDLGKQIKN